MSPEGRWRNEYASVMELRMEADGRLHGGYRSTTGSTGSYHVLGWADPRPFPSPMGRSLALSILWRSIGDDPEDSSWHWVSGLGGQLLGEGDNRGIFLLHDMVATTGFPGQAGIGHHLDKLHFQPFAGETPPAPDTARDFEAARMAAGDPGPLSGIWEEEVNPKAGISFRFLDPRHGFVEAELRLKGATFPLWGFADPHAKAGDCRLMGISLAGLVTGDSGERDEAIAMAGSLDLHEMILTLTVFKNRGTSLDLRYTQTRLDRLRLERMR